MRIWHISKNHTCRIRSTGSGNAGVLQSLCAEDRLPDKAPVLALEDELTLTQMMKVMAEAIAGIMWECAAKTYASPIGMRVTKDGEEVYTRLSEGMGAPNLEWLLRKEKVVNKTGHSSFCVFLDSFGNDKYKDMIDDETYGVVGGSFTLVINNEVSGTFTCT